MARYQSMERKPQSYQVRDRHMVKKREGPTYLIIRLQQMTTAELEKADPAKAQKQYGVTKETAEGYIRLEKISRGINPSQVAK